MSKINILDDSTISKIAAGEIIENPASIVKEMIENSIDAGAENITIELKGKITEFIRITDDGIGMKDDDLQIAFKRHSTSKLTKIEDLDNIVSLGFRGEALASISHVADIDVITKTEDSSYGIKATIKDSEAINISKIGAPKGTTFYIRNIFSKIPVRKKYLKSDSTELKNIAEVVEKISLGNPNISIKLIKDNKILINSIGNTNHKNHIFSILGKDIASNLLNVNFKSESYNIKGFISNNIIYRSNRAHQYIYINNRFVRNLEISRSIEKFYHTLIPLNRFPIFILYIDIDPFLVDVNIHPKKHEVKLSNENNLIEILEGLIESVLFRSREVKSLDVKDEPIIEEQSIFEIFNNDIVDQSNQPIDDILEIENYKDQIFKEETEPFINLVNNKEDISNNFRKNPNNELVNIIDLTEVNLKEKLLQTRIVGTIFKTYIILENSKVNEIYLLDQHAAHERILYEEYKKELIDESISRQILLTPEILELSSSEVIYLENNEELFNKLGFQVEKFSETSAIIREVPIIFGAPSYKNMIYDIISRLSEIKKPVESDLYRIMRKACRSAVKSGDNLSDIEIESLLSNLIKCENPNTCPHGRPTIIDINKRQIEKIFLRE